MRPKWSSSCLQAEWVGARVARRWSVASLHARKLATLARSTQSVETDGHNESSWTKSGEESRAQTPIRLVHCCSRPEGARRRAAGTPSPLGRAGGRVSPARTESSPGSSVASRPSAANSPTRAPPLAWGATPMRNTHQWGAHSPRPTASGPTCRPPARPNRPQ